jgi:hypothetical protein
VGPSQPRAQATHAPGGSTMKKLGMFVCLAVGTLALTAPAFPKRAIDQGRGQVIVTVLPKKDLEEPVNITQQNLRVEVSGKESSITDWVPLRGPNSNLQLVILIDSSARTNLGLQLRDIANFIQSLPVGVKVSVGYMNAGSADLAGPLSTDHAQVAGNLQVPNGFPGSSGSPYFCLSDLAKHWPSTDLSARREVVLITDGVDNYAPHYDPTDPYFTAAIKDSVRSGLVVYSIYWRNQGRMDNSTYASFDGQSLLATLTEATGGVSYWEGPGNPVSFIPYFKDIAWRLQNQYRLSFHSPLRGKPEVEKMMLKVGNSAAEVRAPRQVFVER